IRTSWDTTVDRVLTEATLPRPEPPVPAVTGGLSGLHEDDFERLITVMQELARTHPGAEW
ncbi:MAG: Phenylacetic acid catabolic protein, partial [Ilumatobacter sp.]